MGKVYVQPVHLSVLSVHLHTHWVALQPMSLVRDRFLKFYFIIDLLQLFLFLPYLPVFLALNAFFRRVVRGGGQQLRYLSIFLESFWCLKEKIEDCLWILVSDASFGPILEAVHFEFLYINYHIKCKHFHICIFVNGHMGMLACLLE